MRLFFASIFALCLMACGSTSDFNSLAQYETTSQEEPSSPQQKPQGNDDWLLPPDTSAIYFENFVTFGVDKVQIEGQWKHLVSFSMSLETKLFFTNPVLENYIRKSAANRPIVSFFAVSEQEAANCSEKVRSLNPNQKTLVFAIYPGHGVCKLVTKKKVDDAELIYIIN